MRRRNVPCSPCSGGSSSGDCCGLKEKLRILWDRTIGSILRINGISPDGDGDFSIEAGDNINITQVGTGNGLRIDTTGGVSYYTSGDSYVNVDNNDLEISVNVGTGGLATDTDLQTVAGAVTDILDGTSTVPNATDAVNATHATTADFITPSIGNCIASLSTAYTADNTGSQVVKLDQIDNTTDYSISGNKITIKNAGNYLFIANLRLTRTASTSGNYGRMRIVLDGADICSDDENIRADITLQGIVSSYVSANSEVNLEMYWADTGVNLTVNAYAPATFLQIIKLPW